MKEEVIKRSIRIPKRLNDELIKRSSLMGMSINQVILQDLGRLYGIEVGERKRGRRWY